MEQIDIWKKKLLDLGLRNKLLNYRATGRTGLNILIPGIGELYKKLVKQEKTLTFPKVVYETRCRLDENFDNEETIHLIEEKVAKVVPGDIETDKEAENLEKTLKTLKDRARIAVEEQGVNILYMAFGFLEWYEKFSSSQRFLAPLILVPVTIYKENILSAYKLHIHEDEILFNPTLRYKLEQEMGIELPDFDADSDIETYLERLKKLPDIEQFSVIEKCGLGLFSFLKMNMYFDLEKNKDRILENPVLSAMLEKKPLVFDDKPAVFEDLQIVDADSSQQEALRYAMQGKSFILQGPPGTGKSQTITNIIAAAIFAGKKVLFVSEKAAALNVVYQRLSKAGLDNSCLFLHSYKANKKEVLRQLNKTLNSPKIKVHEEAYQKLKELEACSGHLDGYVKQLHEKIEPLQMSIFDVIGKIFAMQDVPNISFSCKEIFGDEIKNVTKEQFFKIQRQLEELSVAFRRMSCDIPDNPWRYANINSLSLTYRQELESLYNETANKLCELENTLKNCEAYYGVKIKKYTVEAVSKIIKLLNISPIDEKPIVDFTIWENEDIEVKKQLLNQFWKKAEDLNKLSEKLSEKYISEISNVNVAQISNGLKALTKLQIKSFSEEEAFERISEMEEYCQTFEKVTKNLQEALDTIKMYRMETMDVADFDFIKEVFVFCAQKITPDWLCHLPYFNTCITKISELERLYSEEEELRNELISIFDDGIFQLEIEYYRRELRYAENWIIPQLHKPYRDLRNALTELVKGSSRFDFKFKNIMDVFSKLDKWHSYKKDIATKEALATKFLGSNFYERETDWIELKENAAEFKRICTKFKEKYLIPLDKVMLSSEHKKSEINAVPFNKEKVITTAVFFTHFEKLFRQTEIFSGRTMARCTYHEIIGTAEEIVLGFKDFTTAIFELKKYFLPSVKFIKSEIDNDLVDIKNMQELDCEISASRNILQQEFQGLYNENKTDWSLIKKYLDWFECLKGFKTYFDCDNILLSLYKGVSVDTTEVKRLEKIYDDVLPDFKRIIAMFDERRDFENAELEQNCHDIKTCAGNISLLEEWIDYNVTRKSCCDLGLSAYIETVEMSGNQDDSRKFSDYFAKSFSKRFYQEWLDAVLPAAEDVAGFRRKKQEALIDEFCMLDLQQFSITQAKIKEKLTMQIPDLNNLISAGDELMILRREIEKKTRIMPLRVLFEKIPNLISLLKPCLMMSPLSVSLFLQSDSYDFDMVVFDEASQVRTEDAVGAVFRAKQVIIAGDKEQLPPTDFFTATVEIEDDDEYEGSFESILDEMSLVLPQKMLKWHYRSRNESLIAFSNKEIYNGELITFPSVTTYCKDCGVEYVYVENGIYNRGGNRENLNEALKVAQLVLRHVKLFPEKSLGVITFSSAQQAAIERIILQIRRDNPEIAYFFDEDRPAAFFVKNLENVQGDERDTIIFSIGYGKDSNGLMSMNFGPLSRDGGYRRLNVAITRAKYNLKLVGSILPEDIKNNLNDEKESARGVSMLKSYIEFAIADKKHTDITTPDAEQDDVSQFENMLFDLLTASGYKVVRRPGFSCFKIDLAVVNAAGDFALGIMCDGQMYKSAVTVRERERLRYTMLNEIGWKIYKVWSYEWLKNPEVCKKDLLNAVENALQGNGKDTKVDDVIESKQITFEDFSAVTQVKTEIFEDYKEADIFTVKRRENEKNNDFLIRVADYIIENEAPVSFDTLCIRLAPLLGYKKLCSTLQNSVANIMNGHCSDFERVGNFFIKENGTVVARKAGNRAINQIATEELEKCILAAVKSSVGIFTENVCAYTSKLMGFQRMTSQISDELEKVLNNLVMKDALKIINGKVCLAD